MQRTIIQLIAGALIAHTGAFAMNGFSVSTAYTEPIAAEYEYGNAPCYECGSLVRYDISGNKVSAVDTIYKGPENGLAEYPVISFDGTRIAFFRSGLKTTTTGGVRHAVAGSATAQCYLSVINKDGTGLINLIPVNRLAVIASDNHFPDGCAPEPGCAVLAWPSGDWIYYDKPTKTGEIWRVNVNDPSANQLVVKYRTEWLMNNVRAPQGFPLYFRRWAMSADARWCAYQTQCSYGGVFGNGATSFPAPNGDGNLCLDATALPGCNASISPSGSLIANYYAGYHQDVQIHSWPRVGWHDNGGSLTTLFSNNDLGNVESWSGQKVQCNGSGQVEWIRWAANSDKWVARMVKMDNFLKPNTHNQILQNPWDRAALRTSENMPACGSAAPAYQMNSDAGQLWVAGGPANSYEDRNGQWHEVPPVGIFNTVTATGTNPYQVTITTFPAGADIYYTQNGADPTQSSTKYTGPFSVTAPDSPAVALKIRSFKTGLSPSEITTTRIAAGAPTGTGLNVELWKGITGDVAALTSNPKYNTTPDSTFMVTQLMQPDGVPGSSGYRYRGYLIAPATGNYLFEIVSAAQSSLRLSTSESPAAATEVARQDWEYSNDPWTFNGGTKGSRHLAGGKKYYLEVVKNSPAGGGAGYMVARWTLPWGEREQPIAGKWLVPFNPAVVQNRGNGMEHATALSAHGDNITIYSARGMKVRVVTGKTSLRDILSALPAGSYIIKMQGEAIGAKISMRLAKAGF